MKKLIMLALLGAALSASADAAPVTWSFYETGLVNPKTQQPCPPGNFSPPVLQTCFLPPQPFVLVTLALPGPTSSGSAVWSGYPNAPIYTGDSFALDVNGAFSLTSAFSGNSDCLTMSPLHQICNFDISWLEIEGRLDEVSISVFGERDEIGTPFAGGPLQLTQGGIASDLSLGGCVDTQCLVTGFWTDLPITEPGSLALLVSGLIGIGFVRGIRPTQPGTLGW